jgi:phosphate transport system permease protein
MSSTASAPPLAASDVFDSRPGEISQAPSGRQMLTNRVFWWASTAFAWMTVALVVFIVARIAVAALPAIGRYGVGFLTGRVWDPNTERYGILGEIWGTMYTSVLALGLGTALQRFNLHLHPAWAKLPDSLERFLKNLVELLAAIPSVVYGLWGLFVVIPLIRPMCNWLHLKLGWIPLFSTDLSGPGVLPAVIVLSIMILPTITAISRDALVSVPPKLRMAAYGLGATRWEALLAVILPTASRGILGGVVLAFGRALGETMALAMLVGNSNQVTLSVFSPANTLAALLANNFPEAGVKQVGVLMYAALVLLAITLVVNILGALIIQRASLARVD